MHGPSPATGPVWRLPCSLAPYTGLPVLLSNEKVYREDYELVRWWCFRVGGREKVNVFGGGTSFCRTDSHGGVILRQQQSTGLSSNLGQFDIVHTIFSCNPCCRNKRKKHKVFLDAPGWALPPNIGNVEVRTLNIYSQIKWTYASPYTCPNSVHCHINKNNDVCFWHQ
jgi:hypothetical protein